MSYEPPAGILVGPPSMTKVEKGQQIEAFLPPTFSEIVELGKARTGPSITPLGIVRAPNPDGHCTFDQIMRVWIAPEVERRVQLGTPREAVTPIRQALVVFPPRSNPERHRVLLNDEVRARAAVKPSYTSAFSGAIVGDQMTISLRDMFDLREFSLEGVDMKTDGFAWLRPEAGGWALYFNFLPNSPLADQISEPDRDAVTRSVQDAIAQEMLGAFLHGVFTDDLAVRNAMAADGWCPTPVLLPEPWKSMCDAYAKGDATSAERSALEAVGSAELDSMVASWITVEPFASDRRFLEAGVRHYGQGDFISAVSVLLPRIEGLANRVRASKGLGTRDSISQVFQSLDQLATAEVRDGYLATRIRDEFAALIASFLLAHFRPSAPGADGARGRHAHAHGVTAEPHYDQAYALKIILALDALYFISR